MLSGFERLFEIPNFIKFFLTFMLPKDGIDDMKAYCHEKGNAWDLGAISPHISIPFCPEERQEPIKNRLMDKFNCANEDELYNLPKKMLKRISKSSLIKDELLADKISALVEKEKDLLILQPVFGYEDLLLRLKKKIELIGPIREDINPRGFLFEIKKVDKVVGYFLGSSHITPKWILENFNSKTREAFEACNVLGVEVDITRDDVKEALICREYDIKEDLIPLMVDIVGLGLIDLQVTLKEEYVPNELLSRGKTDLKTYIRKGLELITKTLHANHGFESGIDLAFIEKAKKRNIKVIDLESIDTHKRFMDLDKSEQVDYITPAKDMKPQDLWLFLKNSIVKVPCERNSLILETGYIGALESHVANYSKVRKEVIYARNMEMCIKTHHLICQGNTPFSIAGAAHFAGAKSMIQIMRDLGYTITQIICEEPRGS